MESDERWQDAFRDKFKKLGYRVLLAGDPSRAADRFRQHPFDTLIMDVGTVCEEGLTVFENIMIDANRKNLEAVQRYCHQQGLINRMTPIDELFADTDLGDAGGPESF